MARWRTRCVSITCCWCAQGRRKKLIDDMHNPAAAEYHQWLTPQQIGARVRLAAEDLKTLQRWLESHGFAVNRVYANGLVVDFSGTAGEVREALLTDIHHLVLANGEAISRTFAIRKSRRRWPQLSTASHCTISFRKHTPLPSVQSSITARPTPISRPDSGSVDATNLFNAWPRGP